MKRKFIVVFSCIAIILVMLLFIQNNFYASKKVISSHDHEVFNTDGMLTMMYEITSGSGNYEVSSDTSWPSEGYIFNAEMSKCENGSKLYWNDENKTVMLEANVSDKCYVYFDKYRTVNITKVSTSNISNSSITLTVSATAGDNSIAKYYYSSNNGSSYVESTSNTYTFNGLSTATKYNFKVYAVDSAGQKSNVYSLSASTSSAVYLADYIKGLYTSDGTNGLYLHDGSGTYGSQEAGDNSYRYTGSNPNNYVCFGSDASTCPNDNLYRIIGVFGNQVKLIKHDYAGQSVLGTSQHGSANPGSYYKGSLSTIPYYYWSGSSGNTSNTWSSSTLNTNILNGTYLNKLGSKWSNLIATHTWQVGGAAYSNVVNSPVKTAYNYEVGPNKANTTYNAKIGLMYASDYGYAASPDNWSTDLYDYDNNTNRNNNWMFMGATEWTISRRSVNTNLAFRVRHTGRVNFSRVNDYYGVRPSFYLESTVVLSKGSGTSADPYRVA